MKTRISWNGGHNGWMSVLFGIDWRVDGYGLTFRERAARVRAGRWWLGIHLGLWVVTFQGSNYGNP